MPNAVAKISGSSMRRACFIALAFLLIIGFQYIPAPDGLPQLGMQVLGIFLGMLVIWLTVSVTWASILCLLMMSLLPGMGVESIFAKAFGNWLFPFLICAFSITYTLSRTQFIRRCVLFLVSRKFASKNAWNFIILLFASICLIGLFCEPTVLFLMFLPVVEDIFHELGLKKGDKIVRMIIMGLIMCCSVSSIMTPISHTFPLIAIAFYQRDTGISIDYGTYSVFGIAIGIVILAIMMLIFRLVLRPDLSAMKNLNVEKLKSTLTPMENKEKAILIVFGIVIICWILPSIISDFAPDLAAVISSHGNATPAMIGVVVLAILTNRGKPILDFVDCMKTGVPWPGIFMACSIFALGSVITMEEVGLVNFLISVLSPITQNLGPLMFVVVIIVWTIFMTNFCSDMVTITVVYTVAMPLAIAAGYCNPAVIACLLGASSALAFATPAATSYISVAAGTEWFSLPDMFKYGMLLSAFVIVIVLVVGYPILNLIFPM